ncbi:MAG: biotin/lipoyl-binding protein [Rhodobacteraceae bacterium]|nr:biotin/lipoyl-binding protein [Paracoccaceae bacterium]
MRVGFKLITMTLPIILLGVGFVAYTISSKPAPAQEDLAERAVAVRIVEARKTAISPRASGFGLITPARSYDAIAQVSGTAEYVNPLLKVGGILPEGAVLLRLSDSDYKLAQAQAQANIRAAQARLAEISVSQSNLKSALEIEQETLDLKAREVARLRRLFDAGTASEAAYDGVRAAYLAQRQKVQGLTSSLALIPTQKQSQIEQIAVYQASLKIAELNLGRTELRLPFAGRVAAVSVEVGQLVRSGQTIAAFDGIDAAEVTAQIPAAQLKKLFRQLGGKTGNDTQNPVALSQILSGNDIDARVLLRLGNEYVQWPATVDRISNEIDPKTGTIGVIVRIDDAYTSARPGTRPPLTRGMFVEAILQAAPIQAIPLPRSALRDGRVMIADADNRLRLVPVSVDFVQDRLAVISGGIDEGARIVVSNPVPLIEGLLLELHPDQALMQELGLAGAEK